MNNTIIVYASRHGTTAEYAKKLLKMLDGNVDLCFLNERENSLPDLTVYNTFVIGGSIHYGRINKSVVNFCNNNYEMLMSKRLGLFITCYFEGDNAQQQLKNAFPKGLHDRAVASTYFDGELLYPKMNYWEKMVAKLVLKADEVKPLLSKPRITDFANKLNQQHGI